VSCHATTLQRLEREVGECGKRRSHEPMPIKNLADAVSKKCRWSNHRHHVDQNDDFDNGGEKEPYAKENRRSGSTLDSCQAMGEGLLSLLEFHSQAAIDGCTSLKTFENVGNCASILVPERLTNVHPALTTE